jgi:hypothetical protein
LDDNRFDQLVKTLARTGDRRDALRAMGAAGMAVLGAFRVVDAVDAKKHKQGKKSNHANKRRSEDRHRNHHHDGQGKDETHAERKRKRKCKYGLQPCKRSKRKRICVDFQTDVANCGGCGNRCADDQTCLDGLCFGTAGCLGADLQTDASNCGACGEVCGANQTCQSGQCQETGACINPGTCDDRPNCGPHGTNCSCGTTVEGAAFCTGGGSCGSLQTCTATSDCPPDFACSLGCCSNPICVPACVPSCTPEPVNTTCAGKECGNATNNCGDQVSCGTCGAGDYCDHGSCAPVPALTCPGCGTCQHLDVQTDAVGACTQNCLAGSLCPTAQANADFDRLYGDLLSRGFTVSGDAYAVEIDEVSGLPDASILIFPFANSDSGDTAGLSYGVVSSGGPPIPIAVIGDAEQSPYMALVVDNGAIQEIPAASGPLSSRHLQRLRAQATSGPPWTCRRCSAYCRIANNLSGIGIGVALAVVAIAATGVGAIALAIAAGAFVLAGFIAGEFCPNWCGCLYCSCTDSCYSNITECQAVCQPSLACFTGICDPAGVGDC